MKLRTNHFHSSANNSLAKSMQSMPIFATSLKFIALLQRFTLSIIYATYWVHYYPNVDHFLVFAKYTSSQWSKYAQTY